MKTSAPSAMVQVPLLMGGLLASEGIQKFLFPVALGAGWFANIGFTTLEWMAFIPLVASISVTMVTTKRPMLKHQGFWALVHEAHLTSN